MLRSDSSAEVAPGGRKRLDSRLLLALLAAAMLVIMSFVFKSEATARERCDDGKHARNVRLSNVRNFVTLFNLCP